MGYEDAAFQQAVYVFGYLAEEGCIGNHLLGDAGERGDVNGYFLNGVNEGMVAAFYLVAVVEHNSKLCNGVISCISSGSFYIDYGIHRVDKDRKTRCRMLKNLTRLPCRKLELVQALMVSPLNPIFMKIFTPTRQESVLLTAVTVVYFVAILAFAYLYVQA